MAKQNINPIKLVPIAIGIKFKQKNTYGMTHQVMTIDEEKNLVYIKTKDKNQGNKKEEGQKWRLDDILYFLGTGDYEIINERPSVSKNGQFENEGAYAE